MISGLLLFARYAYPPNRLGYCGPDEHGALLEYLTGEPVDPGLTRLAQRFEGAYPYLRLIAASNGIPDPFDRRVVEAYWVGNALLDRVGVASFFDSLRSRFRQRMDRGAFSSLTAALDDGSTPHHDFHVFEIYRRAGLLRDERATIALDRMDKCRISWGGVVSVDGAELVVSRAPLVLKTGKLALGPPERVRILRQIDGRGYLEDFHAGEIVSIHWNWACDRLSPSAARALARVTQRAIAHTNLTI